jgi:ATP-binding cassette subfamily B protein
MRKLLKYLKPYMLYVVLSPLLMIIEVTSELMIPKIMSNIVDIGIANNDNTYILTRGLVMLVVAVIGAVGGIGNAVTGITASMGFATDVRRDMLKCINSFSFNNLDKFHTSSLVTRLTNDITQLQQIVMMALRMLVRSPVTFIGGMIMAMTISPRLTLNLVVAAVILIVAISSIIRYTFPLFKLVQTKIDNVNTIMREALSGARVIKAFVRQDKEREKFAERNAELRDTTIKAFRTMTMIIPVMMIVMNLVTAVVLWQGGKMVYFGSMPTGDLMAYITYLTQILMSLMMVGMVMMMLSRAKASVERVNEVLDTESDIISAEDAVKDVIKEGHIAFDNVSFKYVGSKGDNVLENISLDIEAGTTVGILGETGAGKSSLVNLIPRLYDITEGSITIDGVDVRKIDLSYLRKSIGMVLQKNILFSGTIEENIRWGKPNATKQEIITAAENAQAIDFINDTENGFDTKLAQMGANLSGGQKQRLTIARALIKEPKILIFDDSTSALDAATEAKIQHTLRHSYKNCTKIIIAQKVSSVMHADKIAVLHSGRLVALGSHNELMETSTEYQEIYHSQIREEAI